MIENILALMGPNNITGVQINLLKPSSEDVVTAVVQPQYAPDAKHKITQPLCVTATVADLPKALADALSLVAPAFAESVEVINTQVEVLEATAKARADSLKAQPTVAKQIKTIPAKPVAGAKAPDTGVSGARPPSAPAAPASPSFSLPALDDVDEEDKSGAAAAGADQGDLFPTS